jgi:hypothetical protein
MMKAIIKFILAVLLIVCVISNQDGYYPIIRIGAIIGFIVLAYMEFREKNEIVTLVCIVCVIILNPWFKINFLNKSVLETIGFMISGYLLSQGIYELWIYFKVDKKSNQN